MNEDRKTAIERSNLFDAKWYVEQYPDVALSGLDPLTHFLMIGLDVGRDPGIKFNTRFYRSLYRDIPEDVDPLLHYIQHGRGKNRYRTLEHGMRAFRAAQRSAGMFAYKIFTLGFDMAAKEARKKIKGDENPFLRILVAEVLAQKSLWHHAMGQETDGAKRALGDLTRAKSAALPEQDQLRQELLGVIALASDGQAKAARAIVHAHRKTGRMTGDLELALTSLDQNESARLDALNAAFARYDRSPLKLAEGAAPALMRISGASSESNRSHVGVSISVVVACNAQTTLDELSTTLDTVETAAWGQTDIILTGPDHVTHKAAETHRASAVTCCPVSDDASYGVAWNAGMAAATGLFATAIMAGDLMHPDRLRLQARALLMRPDALLATAGSVWLTPDLKARAWCGAHGVGLVFDDPGAAMIRRVPCTELLGDRDPVSGGAREFIVRAALLAGDDAVLNPATGPVTLLNDDGRRGDPLAQGPLPRGAHLDYLEAQNQHHTQAADTKARLRYDLAKGRPFAAPVRLTGQARPHYDVILASDLRLIGGSTLSNASELRAQRRAGLKTGLLQMYRYDFYKEPWRPMLPEVRAEIDGETVQVLAEGDAVSCDLLVLRYPPILRYPQSIVPRIDPGAIKVIINQPPMSDYSDAGKLRYQMEEADDNVLAMFGKRPVWHPIGPLVREALHTHHAAETTNIDLSPDDWYNIIDVGGWARTPRGPESGDRPRVGRHSRDHAVKWPDTAEEILAAYPANGPFDVHVLGGATAPAAVLGQLPKSWRVHDFGTLAPQEFLSGLDFWVYFSHSSWVESFGRTIIEAMAVGMPVLLPEIYRPLFGDHAIYCTPDQVQDVVMRLWADREAYHAHVRAAQDYVRNTYSYEVHAERLYDAGVARPVPPKPEVIPPENRFVIPRGSLKNPASDLKNMPRLSYKTTGDLINIPALYKHHAGGHIYDFLFSPNAGTKKLFVLFSGDAMRKKYDPPVFQRWKWAEAFPGHCLYISDPALYLDEKLGLAWYAGNKDFDPMTVISRLITDIATTMGVPADGIVTYGSSGGGFAALRALTFLPQATAVPVNPQTDITQYEFKNVERYTEIAFGTRDRGEALKLAPRLSLFNAMNVLRSRRIIYMQNSTDTHHLNEHFIPFRDMLGPDAKNFEAIIFDVDGGHGAAEPQEAFDRAMKIIVGS